MVNEVPLEHRRFRWWPYVRYFVGLLLGVAVLLILFFQRGNLRAAWHELARVSLPWLMVAIVAEAMSIYLFSLAQHRTLLVSNTRITLGALFAISLANNAIANTVPGEPAVSSAFRYQQYRRRGASRATSSWTILTIIIAQAIGMSSLLLVGVLVSLFTSSNATNTRVTVVGLLIVCVAIALLIRQDLLVRFLERVVRVVRRVTGHPRGDVAHAIQLTLDRIREIPLRAFDAFQIIALASLVWVFDFACLTCSFQAAHAALPWHGILLAYGVAQIVAVLPIVPGGVGLVEGGLTVILVAYGSTRIHALSTVLVYRAISFWLAISVGWASFFVLSLMSRRGRAASLRSVDDDVSTK